MNNMDDTLEVVAEKAVSFTCWACQKINYEAYELTEDFVDGVECMSDVIACERCGRDNKVIEHLDKPPPTT